MGNPSKDVDGWLAIAADGSVTAFTGKCEMGQGLYTAQTQLVAEELCVPVTRVKLIQCQTGTTPDQGVTSGAQSHPQNFNHSNLALAGATAREALLQMASKHLGAPVDQLTVRDGVVTHQTRKVTYGELIGGRKFNLALSSTAKRRHPREWTVLGTSVKRLDMPEMVTGRLEYVAQRARAGYGARSSRPPADRWRDAREPASEIESSVSSMPGFVKVVVKNNFVGVVFEKQWQAIQAADKTEGDVEARARASCAGELLRSHAQAAEPRHVARRFKGCRRAPRVGRAGCAARPTCIRITCTDRSALRAPSPT